MIQKKTVIKVFPLLSLKDSRLRKMRIPVQEPTKSPSSLQMSQSTRFQAKKSLSNLS